MPDPETPTNPQHVLPEGKYLILGPSDSFGEDSSGSPTWLTIEMDETGKARPVFKTLKYQNPNALWVFKEGRLLITSSNSVSTPASDYALTLNKGQVTLETPSHESMNQTGWKLRMGSIMNWIFIVGSDGGLALPSAHINPGPLFFRCRPIAF
jgi:hypothetical protein